MNQIRYVEHNAAHPGDFIYDVPGGHESWLLVFTHTPALFWVDETWMRYPEKSIVLFAPYTKILYKACGELLEYDWLRFDSDEEYVSSLPLMGAPFSVPDPTHYHGLFCRLTWAYSNGESMESESINSLIQTLFLSLHKAAKVSNQLEASLHFHALADLRKSIYADPKHKWRVGEMAARLHLSEGHLQALYHRTFGVACMEDVILSRIRSAESLLRHTNKTSTQIAEFCGYNNAEHFCRQFKKTVGQTPGQYRERIKKENAE